MNELDYQKLAGRMAVMVLSDLYDRVQPVGKIKPELGNLRDIADKFFRGNTEKASAFLYDQCVPHYMAETGHKMFRFDDVWKSIAETMWKER